MKYELVLSKLDKTTKTIGENVFFDRLPAGYEVYALYYSGVEGTIELENKLRKLGDMAGKNLFVNIGKLNDPNYRKIRHIFNIRRFPSLIMTGLEELASPPNDFYTAYVKMDNEKLLKSPDLTVECAEKVWLLFLEGEIFKAIKVKNHAERDARIKDVLNRALKGISGFLKQWEISVSFIEGRFSLKPAAGG